MACRGPCSVTYAQVTDLTSVVIRSIRRVQLNVRTGAEIAGTQTTIPPASIPNWLRRAFESRLRNFSYRSDDCAPGCYCDSSGQTSTSQENITGKFTFLEKPRRAQGNAKVPFHPISGGLMSDEETIREVLSGSLAAHDSKHGNPLPIDPALDELLATGRNCCANIYLELDVLNHFKNEIDFTAPAALVNETGTCRRLMTLQGKIV